MNNRSLLGRLFLTALALLSLGLLFTPAQALYKQKTDGQPVLSSPIVRENFHQLRFEELEKLKNNTRWIIELKEVPLLELRAKLSKQGLKPATLSARVTEHKTALQAAKSRVKEKLPEGVVKREFTNVFSGFTVEASVASFESLKGNSDIKRIFPDSSVKLHLMDVVPIIGADQAWQVQDSQGQYLTGQGVTIAILDSGVDYTHADFGATCSLENFPSGQGCQKFAGGYDLWNNDPDPMDDHGHGTHVAAIAAGDGVLKGVAPAARLYAYKVLGKTGDTPDTFGSLSSVIAGIEMAMDPNQDGDFSDHADVIHMSLGLPGSPDDLWSTIVNNAVDNGAVVTVSAGNDGPGYFSIGSPAHADKAIAVGATCKPFSVAGPDNQCNTILADFSSRGPTLFGGLKPDIVAPGRMICAGQSSQDTLWQYYMDEYGLDVHCLDSEHIFLSGTSMAAPAVAGVAALLKQKNPLWSPQEIKNTLKGVAADLDFSPLFQGNGIVNALAAALTTSPYPSAEILKDNELFVDGIIEIKGTVFDTDFNSYYLEYGLGVEPENWINISSGTSPVIEGRLGSLDTSLVLTPEFSIRLTVFDNAGQKSSDRIFLFKRHSSFKPGWPKRMVTDTSYQWFAPVIADLDDDGNVEIIAGSAGSFESKVYVWDSQGNIMPGWPQEVNPNGGSNPAVGDLDGDGDLEIVYKSTSLLGNFKSTVYAFHHDGRPLNDNWPKDIGWELVSLTSPIVEDIDSDGKDEVILCISPISDSSGIKIWNEDGTEITGGWSKVSTGKIIDPAVADWDKDGNKEIIFASDFEGKLYIWDTATGQLEPGFPKQFPYAGYLAAQAPIIADIDSDAELEIILKLYYKWDSRYFAFDDLEFRQISPIILGPALSTSPMIVSSNKVFSSQKSPVVADVDNDQKLEIITYDSGSIYAWEMDGSLAAGWPVNILPYELLSTIVKAVHISGAAIGDVDNDSKSELVLTLSTGSSQEPSIGTFEFVIDLEGQAKYVDWPMFQHSAKHTGFYKFLYLCGDVNNDGKLSNADASYLSAYLFRSGPEPVYSGSADVNADGSVNISDLTYLINYFYRSGPAPVCVQTETNAVSGPVKEADSITAIEK